MKPILVCVFMFLAFVGVAKKKQSLFNGKDLKGWTAYVNETTVDLSKYFYVKDGAIETVGVPSGYLRTKKSFSNYQLHVEWRWPEKATNSGIMLHVDGPNKIWVPHIQAQLRYPKSGEIMLHGIGVKVTARDSIYVSTEKVKPSVPTLHSSNEKPLGEWNSYDITCNGDVVELKVNGLLQNVAKNCSLSKGSIALQAEGSKIQFRNIWIKEIN